MDFFLNWCINCGKRSDYLYCCKECRLNDLKRKTTSINENNYTLEFKNRKPVHNHGYYKNSTTSPQSPLLKVNIPSEVLNSSRSSSISSTSSDCSSSSDMNSVPVSNENKKPSVTIYSSPPKEIQRPRYFVQTFHNMNTKNNQIQSEAIFGTQQPILTPSSEKDNMECDTAAFNNQYSEEEAYENSSHWYWSSDSDDEEDDF